MVFAKFPDFQLPDFRLRFPDLLPQSLGSFNLRVALAYCLAYFHSLLYNIQVEYSCQQFLLQCLATLSFHHNLS